MKACCDICGKTKECMRCGYHDWTEGYYCVHCGLARFNKGRTITHDKPWIVTICKRCLRKRKRVIKKWEKLMG